MATLLTPAQESEALRRYVLAKSLRREASKYKTKILAERFGITRGRIDRFILIGLNAALKSKSYQQHGDDVLRELQACLDRRYELLEQVAQHTALRIAADYGVPYRKLMQGLEYRLGRDGLKPAPEAKKKKVCPVASFLRGPVSGGHQSVGYY